MRDYVKRKGCYFTLNVSTPQSPQITAPLRSNAYSAFRVAVAPEYAYTNAEGMAQSAEGMGQETNVIDLAVTTSMQGRIHTVDITDPYNPTVMGVTKDSAGNEVIAQATDITISKTSGLVYITSGMSVYIIDIKDPRTPKLLNTITQTPLEPGSSTLTALGSSTALVEKDGWVYLANQQQGMRVLDLDPIYIEQYCNDSEFEDAQGNPKVHIPCDHFYPALARTAGTNSGVRGKTFKIRGWDANQNPATAPAVVYVKNNSALLQKGAIVTGETTQGSTLCASLGTSCTVFSNGMATLYVAVTDAFNEKTIQLELESLMNAGQLQNTERFGRTITLYVKDNSNVTFGEVLNGEAVFVADCKLNEDHTEEICNSQGGTDIAGQKGFYFIQELLNQIIPRKRSIIDPFTSNANTAYAYQLIDEDGRYGADTYDSLVVFKKNFQIGVNEKVGPYDPNNVPHYSNDRYDVDDTSNIFRKIMKDYGKRKIANPWLSNADWDWRHKIIDRDTLFGKDERIPKQEIALTVDNSDSTINDLAERTKRNDSGLYELYKNVVERFVTRMINEAERYAGMRNDVGFGIGVVSVPTADWTSRNGKGPVEDKPNIDTKSRGMSYSYDGKMSVDIFNDNVTVDCHEKMENKAYGVLSTASPRIELPSPIIRYLLSLQFGTMPSIPGTPLNPTVVDINYKGNLDDACSIGQGTFKYPGLARNEYNSSKTYNLIGYSNKEESTITYFNALHSPQPTLPLEIYKPDHWAGIDCSGLVQRSINAADKLGIPGASSTVLELGDSGDYQQYTSQARGSAELVVTCTQCVSQYTYVIPFSAANAVATLGKAHRGDLIVHKRPHIVILHSDKPDCGTTACNYEIIHAYGVTPYQQLNEDGKKIGDPIFSRKVIKTNNNIGSEPTGFGRIKLWD